jgi:hypothetical protein
MIQKNRRRYLFLDCPMVEALLPRIPPGDTGVLASADVVQPIAQRRFREQAPVRPPVKLRKLKAGGHDYSFR